MKELGIRPLFQYECGETTQGRYVSCMDWNEVNPDLLAVSYGEFDHELRPEKDKREGLLLFWTLKNPKFPERTIKTKSRIFKKLNEYRNYVVPVLEEESEPDCNRRL